MVPFALIGLTACQSLVGSVEGWLEQDRPADDGARVAYKADDTRSASAEDMAVLRAVQAIEPEEPQGFLSRLNLQSRPKSSETEAAELALAGLVVEEQTAPSAPSQPAAEPSPEPKRETKRGGRAMPGLFGMFNREEGRPEEPAPAAQPDPQPAARQPAPQPAAKPRVAATDPTKTVVPGTVMAFGNIGRVCGLQRGEMGSRVAQYPERGAQYRIFDLAPDATHSRTFYLTGFEDGCARQISGAMVMFGDIEMHESIRYGAPGSINPGSQADKGYDRVKSQVCKVGRNKPCGAKLRDLQRDTVFVSVYETFGNGGRWSNILLHNGRVEASDVLSPPK